MTRLHLPSCQSCTVRVIVTDGMNTVTSDVTDLKIVPNRAPKVRIVAPQDGEMLLFGTNVILYGSVSDKEDGEVVAEEDDLSVAWTSSLDGTIGYGTSLNTAALSLGTHTLTLTASDSGGAQGSDVITVRVEP